MVRSVIAIAFSALIVLTECTTATAPGLGIDDLIERNTEALGGRDRLEELLSVRIQRSKNVITLSQRPLNHIVYIRGDDGSVFYAEGYNGEYAWEQYESPRRHKVEGRPETALWQTLQFPKTFNPLYRVREAGHSVELAGEEEIDGQGYYVINVTLTNGSSAIYYVNTINGLVERTSGKRRHHAYEENEKRIETVWSDFRIVDGYVFPFVETERDLDTGEILSGGKPFLSVIPNFIVDKAVFGLEGSYESLLLPED